MLALRLLPLLLFLAIAPAAAQNSEVDCSLARDPERCTAHQTALAACADQRGKKKTACLAEHMPPIDCGKARNPTRCEAIERAKQVCAGKSGKALKSCINGERPAKKAKPRRSRPAKTQGN